MTELRAAVAYSLKEQARRALANSFHGCCKEIQPPYTKREPAYYDWNPRLNRIIAVHAWIVIGTDTILCELCAAVLDGVHLMVPVPDIDQFPVVRCGQKIPPQPPTPEEFPRDPYSNLGYKPLNKKLSRYLPNRGRVGR